MLRPQSPEQIQPTAPENRPRLSRPSTAARAWPGQNKHSAATVNAAVRDPGQEAAAPLLSSNEPQRQAASPLPSHTSHLQTSTAACGSAQVRRLQLRVHLMMENIEPADVCASDRMSGLTSGWGGRVNPDTRLRPGDQRNLPTFRAGKI
ncbi:hypothetical protein SKAU_G00161950 [Synaphobranchus kaupii]|uniref:Uncharacterized protein n=1 Tax=Synaphobranchus kaupii TaxID=118154 RepID=A0A9Q1IZU9_SYNKA|nr:hypothetical protein SKAU_G00161950 [Synaphobranchus kaupii]